MQKINVDMIVSSTFCNADRLKYKTWRFFEGGPEFKVLESEARIQDLLTQWSVNCYEFDLEPGEGRLQDSELREKLYKVNIPVDEIYFIAHDKAEWVAMTKDLKWYGPFVSETS